LLPGEVKEYSFIIDPQTHLSYPDENGIPVLGIDPAEAPVKKAREMGIDTMNTFFTSELAEELVESGKKADVFLANKLI